jgi:hypothetical protein
MTDRHSSELARQKLAAEEVLHIPVVSANNSSPPCPPSTTFTAAHVRPVVAAEHRAASTGSSVMGIFGGSSTRFARFGVVTVDPICRAFCGHTASRRRNRRVESRGERHSHRTYRAEQQTVLNGAAGQMPADGHVAAHLEAGESDSSTPGFRSSRQTVRRVGIEAGIPGVNRRLAAGDDHHVPGARRWTPWPWSSRPAGH